MTTIKDKETGYSEVEYTEEEARELVIRRVVDDGDLPTNLQAVDDHTDEDMAIPTSDILSNSEIDLLNSYLQIDANDEDQVVEWLLDEVEPMMYKGVCYSCGWYNRENSVCLKHATEMKHNDYCSLFKRSK